MTTPRLLSLIVACASVAGAACDTYDPPPEVALRAPAKGQWFPATALELKFTEAIDPASLRFAIWPITLDKEGELLPGTEPVVDKCTLASDRCGELTISLSDDGTLLTIQQGEAFKGRLAKPFFIEVAAGLTDVAGRPRQVPTRLVFQIDPPPGSGPVDLELNSGVFSIAADLGDILAGVFLRMFADMGIDEQTGDVWLMATVAGKISGAIPNTVDPEEMDPKLGTEGWTLLLTGRITPLEEGGEGAFFLETVAQDIDVKVLGIIRVQLQGLRLRATLRLAADPDGRDTFEGVLSADKVLLGDDGDDLGAVTAADWLGFGILPEELSSDPRFAGFPKLCDVEPCATLLSGGGDCQLPDPWVPVPSCP